MSHYKLPFMDRLTACWLILTNKEFYLEVVTNRYQNGNELSTAVYSNCKDTKTAVNRLKKGLNISLKMIKSNDKTRK